MLFHSKFFRCQISPQNNSAIGRRNTLSVNSDFSANTSPCISLVGVGEDSCLSLFSLWLAIAAHVPLQSVWGLSFSGAAWQRAERTLGGSAWAGAPRLAAGCPGCPQWASRSANLGGLGEENNGKFSDRILWPHIWGIFSQTKLLTHLLVGLFCSGSKIRWRVRVSRQWAGRACGREDGLRPRLSGLFPGASFLAGAKSAW